MSRLIVPSKIKYSQDSISNKFHDGRSLDKTLKAICDGSMKKREIPKITVTQQDGEWITHDNRRLWLYKELQKRGKCKKIPVEVTDSIPTRKMTAKHDGKDIRLRDSTKKFEKRK